MRNELGAADEVLGQEPAPVAGSGEAAGGRMFLRGLNAQSLRSLSAPQRGQPVSRGEAAPNTRCYHGNETPAA